MPANYSVNIQNARMTVTRDACVDGTLEITTSTDTVIVAHGLTATGGTVSGGAWTLAFDAATVAATASGTAAKARIKSAGGAVEVDGLTVTDTAGSGDVKLQNTSINAGQNIEFNSAVITHWA